MEGSGGCGRTMSIGHVGVSALSRGELNQWGLGYTKKIWVGVCGDLWVGVWRWGVVENGPRVWRCEWVKSLGHSRLGWGSGLAGNYLCRVY